LGRSQKKNNQFSTKKCKNQLCKNPKDDDFPNFTATETSRKSTLSRGGKTAVVQKSKTHPKIKGLKVNSPKFLSEDVLIGPSILYLQSTTTELMRNAFIVHCSTASARQGRTALAVSNVCDG
jgi:hypothetical protein